MFVFYDDVNFINKGWINRNRILLNNKDHTITIPCQNASQNRLIKDIELSADNKVVKKLLMTIHAAYSKAPEFKQVYPLIENIFNSGCSTISELAIRSILDICDYLDISAEFKTSSESYNNIDLKKGDRLIDICQIEQKGVYINPEGGKAIYTKEYFKEKGVNLQFLTSKKSEYSQFKQPFVPWLSIIDVLMFNSKADIVGLLGKYELT